MQRSVFLCAAALASATSLAAANTVALSVGGAGSLDVCLLEALAPLLCRET
jgi:predicted small secreted protein